MLREQIKFSPNLKRNDFKKKEVRGHLVDGEVYCSHYFRLRGLRPANLRDKQDEKKG